MKNLNEYTSMLYVIDMVNGFVNDGILHDKTIARVIPEQINIIERQISKEEGVTLIKDTHTLNSSELKYMPIHCLEGSSEADIVSELKKYEETSFVYQKNSTNALTSLKLKNDLDRMVNLKEVILVGCCTDICVLNFAIALRNYFDSNNLDIDVVVVKKAVETYDSSAHSRDYYTKISYDLMKQAGIHIVESINELDMEPIKKGRNLYGKTK